MRSIDDKKLIESFVNGNISAFNELVKRYREKIYWQSRRMLGNHLDADEVTQEVLIVLYRKLKTFKFNSALSTWIYKITSTRIINFIRKKKIREFIGIDDNDAINIQDNDIITDRIEAKEKLKKIEKVLQRLPAKQREVFIYRNFNEFSYDEIAEITGRTVGGLKANYFHAIKKVSELIKNEK